MKTILWLREDLRLLDNPALSFAAQQGQLLPVYFFPEGLGGAAYWWLQHSLLALQKAFHEAGVPLILRTGDPTIELPKIAQQTGASLVVWNRVYSPVGIQQGSALKQALLAGDVRHRSFKAQLLLEPADILNKQGSPYKVFTPFWRHCLTFLNPDLPLPIPTMCAFDQQIESEQLDDWGLQPSQPDWSTGLAERWQPGEQGAQQRWQDFVDGAISQYKDGRDFPATHNTSYLSAHLLFGEISVRQIWHDVQSSIHAGDVDGQNGAKFLAEIGWREFSRYLLYHFPKIIDRPFNSRFELFPWGASDKLLQAWQTGQTGYPIVDAGMRELWHTGYMHNRVRMITASFLTKHCLIHWQQGMDWFWDTLVDADIANNTASWQWVAGCGADASPYFRIFNPVLQGEKFDKEGDYVRHWVPELKLLPSKYIHKPWLADAQILHSAGVRLGESYPQPVVDHKQARENALAAYQAIKNN